MSNPLTFPVFFSFFSLFCCWFVLVSCFLFFFLLLFFQHVALFSSFLSVLSVPVRSSYCWWFVLVFISFYFFQFQHFSLSLFVDVVLWCLKLSLTVTRFVMNHWRTLLEPAPNRTMLYSHLHHHSASQWHNINDRRMNKRRTHKGRRNEGRRKEDTRRLL